MFLCLLMPASEDTSSASWFLRETIRPVSISSSVRWCFQCRQTNDPFAKGFRVWGNAPRSIDYGPERYDARRQQIGGRNDACKDLHRRHDGGCNSP